MTPLLELTARRAKGRVVKWLRLVKQPKYFIGLGVGLAYYGWIIFGRMLTSGHQAAPAMEVLGHSGGGALKLAAAMGVAAFLSITFLLPATQPLRFDESEIQYLFTAPLSRRSIIRHALLKFQPGILVGSFASVMLLGRAPLAERALRWPAVWALFTAWFLVSTASGIWKTRLTELPKRQAWTRRIMGWSIVAAYWTAILVVAHATWRVAKVALASSSDPRTTLPRVAAVLDESRGLHVLLAPFETPFLALWPTSILERAIGWGSLALLIAATAEWCARTPLLFEDEVIERAQKVSEVKAQGFGFKRTKTSQKARTRAPFVLPSVGRPEFAIIWKNMLLVGRRRLSHVAGWAIGSLVVILCVFVGFGAPAWLVLPCFIAGCAICLVMALSAGAAWRNDLRMDLLHVDQLRTWPVNSRSLVAAEMASPAFAAFFWIAWALGLAATAPASVLLAGALGIPTLMSDDLTSLLVRMGMSGWGLIVFGPLAALIVVSTLTLLSCALQNTSVLLFPGWSRLGPRRPAGAAMFGQQVLFGIGRLIAMSVGMIPGALVVTLILLAHGMLEIPFFAIELPILALIVAVPLIAETWLLVLFCARLWDRLDASRDLLETSAD